VTTWQPTIDPQRSALCGDVVLLGFGRPVEEHSNKQAYLGLRQGRWRG
jgi:hypothetical protein